MIVTHIILTISSIAWFLTIFRQKSSSVFLFFLILGLADPLNIMVIYLLGVPNGVIYTFACIAFYFVFRFDNSHSIKLKFFDYFVFLIFLYVVVTIEHVYYFYLGIHLFILYKFIQRIITDLHLHDEFSLYFLILVFYQLSALVKIIVFLSGTVSGLHLFFITLAFQILIAIFFIIFREDNPKLIIKLIPSE
jgi:hypothetical protein